MPCAASPAGRPVPAGRAESGDGPGERVVGGELADPPLAVVHHGREFGQVPVTLRIGQVRHAIGPRALRPGEEWVDARADAGVQDAGDVAGAGKVAGLDGRPDDLVWVEPSQFGGAQGAEQPPRLR
jgi:hypothetical protein